MVLEDAVEVNGFALEAGGAVGALSRDVASKVACLILHGADAAIGEVKPLWTGLQLVFPMSKLCCRLVEYLVLERLKICIDERNQDPGNAYY